MRYVPTFAAALAAVSMAGDADAGGPNSCRYYGYQGDWHPNGGGWVHRTAKVDDTVYVGPKAAVCSLGPGATTDRRPEVSGNVVLRGASVITDSAKVSGNVVLRGASAIWDSAEVSGNVVVDDSHIYGFAKVSGNAKILSGAWVEGQAQVSGNAKITGSLMVMDNARVYGSAIVKGSGTEVAGDAEVYGTAVVGNGAGIYGNGKVNCGTWKNIRVTTDRRGECGLNGNRPFQRANDLLDNPLDMGNTQSPDVQGWGDGSLLGNPLDPGNTRSAE